MLKLIRCFCKLSKRLHLLFSFVFKAENINLNSITNPTPFWQKQFTILPKQPV